MVLFNESIKSEYTKKNYNSHLYQFIRFAGVSSPMDLLAAPREQLQQMLENYVIELKLTTNPNSVPSKFQGVRHFCTMNRINLDWYVIHKMFPQKQRPMVLRAYTSEEVSRMLLATDNVRNRAVIHFLASTGARIGVFDHDLLIGHTRTMPDGCSAVRLYAGEVEEYWAFLTPQASLALRCYHDYRNENGEDLDGSSPLFVTQGAVPRQLGWSGTRSAIYRTLSKSGIRGTKQGYRYDVQADHGFRKRFNTILKLDNSVNYNVAEKLMGHKNGLDGVYFTPTLDEMFAEFRKIIHRIEI